MTTTETGLHILYGRAGTGKTHTILRWAARHIEHRDPTRLWVLQPNREAVHDFSRELLDYLGRSMKPPITVLFGVQIHTFATLATAMFDLAGVARPNLLPEAMRPALVQAALRDVVRESPEYGRLLRHEGFHRLLTEFVAESLRNRVDGAKLSEVAQRLARNELNQTTDLVTRASLLSRLLTRYLQFCDTLQLVDPEQLPRLAAKLLDAKPHDKSRLDSRLGTLLVDNFSRFTDAELELLTALTDRAEYALITFCCPKPSHDQRQGKYTPRAFAYLDRTRTSLQQFTHPYQTKWIEKEKTTVFRFKQSPTLAHLEHDLFHTVTRDHNNRPVPDTPQRAELLRQAADQLRQSNAIQRIVAPNVQAEVDAIVNEIRRLHLELGTPLEKIAIVHRDAATYHPLLRSAMRRAGLPLALPRLISLADTELWRAIAAMLRLATEAVNADENPAAELLLSPLFGVDLAARVENEAICHGLTTPAEWLDATMYEDDQVVAYVRQVAMIIDELRRVFAASPFNPAGVVDAIFKALTELRLTRIPTLEALSSARDVFDPDWIEPLRELTAAVERLSELLPETAALFSRAYELGVWQHDTDGKGHPSAAFIQALGEAVRLTKLRLDPAWSRGGVLCDDILRLRPPGDLDVMFVAGLMQGVFPPPPQTDPVLPDRDRKILNSYGVWYEERTVMREHEDFQFYTAVTRPTQRLYLCHAERDVADNEAMPSLFLRDVAAAFGLEPKDLPRVGASPNSPIHSAARCEQAWQQVDDELARGTALDQALTALGDAARVALPWCHLHTAADLMRWTVRTFWRSRPQNAEALAAWNAAAAIWDRWHTTHPLLRLANRDGLNSPTVAVLGTAARAHIRQIERIMSASGLNTFANCAFKHFARYHLNLEERETAEPDAKRWGSLHHRVLEELGEALLAGTVPAEAEPASAWASQRLFELAHDPQFGFPRLLTQPRYQTELRHQQDKLRIFVHRDMEFRSAREVLPLGFEVPFGFGPPDPTQPKRLAHPAPLVLTDPVSGTTLRIRGYIDLLEAAPPPTTGGRRPAIVVDYKSGSVYSLVRKLDNFLNSTLCDQQATLNSTPVHEADGQYTGREARQAFDFQLPIYLLAARELFNFEPAGAFFYSLLHRQKRGVFREDFKELYPTSEINERWDVMRVRRFNEFMEQARKVLLSVARRVESGEIAINPADCGYCEYRDVCRFDKARQDIRRVQRLAAERTRHWAET